jgi:TatD DNase family protein
MASSQDYIDTHCHLDLILARSRCSYTELKLSRYPDHFGGCITVSCDPGGIDPVLALLKEDTVYGAFGIHPHEAKYYDDRLESQLVDVMEYPKVVAWGETGLDYHYNYSDPGIQRKVFIRQINQAVERSKPLIIHSREAEADSLRIMQDHLPAHWKIHLHCYTSSLSLAESLMELFPNLFIGFTGAITFKNATALKDVVQSVPLKRILLETDGPYMAPVPYRGQFSHSGHIPLIAEEIARLKQLSLQIVFDQIRKNTLKMFGV